jgi:sulfatase maturation enzyme AslB (radical SAM superfamily)
MAFESSFCSSPWIHMRINNAGNYEYCRWAVKDDRNASANIAQVTPSEYFQQHMAPIRQAMLAGETVPGCSECAQMEQHHKISGRQKQLLKIGVQTDQFAKTLASSPWVSEFANNPSGLTQQLPQDWQIDLGNYCNSACVMCDPHSSSLIAREFYKLGMINKMPPTAWCNDPDAVDRFVETLHQSPHIQYLHFIGGETLITPAFRRILQTLVNAGLHKTITVGFTTNLTVWDDTVIELLDNFAGVHLGMSVECFHATNDYVRWPSQINQVQVHADQWISLAHQRGWLVQIRTTPTALSVANLLSIYDYAWQHGVAVESCNFLSKPAHLRVSVLPIGYRASIVDAMKQWLLDHSAGTATVTNIRNPNFARDQITQDLQSYVNYLETAPDESDRLPDLVAYLKLLESSRGNSVLTYLPEYEELFRTAGY